jgi:ComF family protein
MLDLLDFAVRWLLPAGCLGCGRALGWGRHRLGLCRPCRHRLVAPSSQACFCCARPLAAAGLPEGYLCGACRQRPPAFERLRAAWAYRPPLDAVIHGLKFQRLQYLAEHLAEGMAQRLSGELAGCSAVVAVPLHWRRRWSRGFNQARAIAEPLAERLGLPLLPALVRSRSTPPQSSLDRKARLVSPRGAFRGRSAGRFRRWELAGQTVVLVDDVVTTGATLDAAARALRRAGAARVVAVAAARTPGPGEQGGRRPAGAVAGAVAGVAR